MIGFIIVKKAIYTVPIITKRKKVKWGLLAFRRFNQYVRDKMLPLLPWDLFREGPQFSKWLHFSSGFYFLVKGLKSCNVFA